MASDGPAPVESATSDSSASFDAPKSEDPILCETPRCWLEDAGWPEEWQDDALRLVECESSGNPRAVGDNGASLGLFQLNYRWFPYFGFDAADYADPRVNARVALALRRYLGRFGGSGGWTCARVVGIY